ncbi:MAG: type II toxin-antitoxin system prevent-host-death family antitoxin [Candidatus Competibacteraceae bacterium]|nr:type II toxin-antitoxin system prevent-host-death family antitoxin [Candidatus Competibacteraceae bacterium]
MKNTITANELKTQGVSLLDKVTSGTGEAIISVHGRTKYIVLTVDEYNRLRECELETAILETKKDIEEGNYIEETVEEHIKRLTRG